MSFQVTLLSTGHSFVADGATPVLQAALDSGLALPYGCRNGACGTCAARLVTGKVTYPDLQPPATLAADQVLLCCCHAASDLQLEVREVRRADEIPARNLPCRVDTLERLAPDVMRLALKLPSSEQLQFMAGQHIEIIFKDGTRRAFSLANAPHEDEHLVLHIRLVPDGKLTPYIFNEMRVKEILRLEGPFGSFCLHEASDKPIIMLAGGTGYAPLRGLLAHSLRRKLTRPLYFYFGARDRAGLYADAEVRAWAAAYPHIRYVPVLSEAADANWRGRVGLAHRAVLEDFSDLAGFQVYVCGAPAMIEAASQDFLAAGLPRREFFADAFTFAKRAS